MSCFVFDTSIYFSAFTDNISVSSVINLAHTAFPRQRKTCRWSTWICPATRQRLYCVWRSQLSWMQVWWRCMSRAIFLLLCRHLIATRELIHSGFLRAMSSVFQRENRAPFMTQRDFRLALNLQFSHMRLKMEKLKTVQEILNDVSSEGNHFNSSYYQSK